MRITLHDVNSEGLFNQFGVNASRIQLTISCRDTDALPKVRNAGQFTGPNDEVQVMHNGVLIARDCYDGSWMTEIIKELKGHHEPQEEVVFHAILERLKKSTRPPVMLELGSYWCYYSLWFLREFPAGLAHCVEPDLNNLEVGRQNMRLNQVDAKFLNALIGDTPGEPADFFCHSDGSTRPVPTESLDSLMFQFDLSHIDILHADIQGAEWPLIRGGIETLKRGVVRFLVVSTHHASISEDDFTHERCLALLSEAGAHIIAEHNVFQSFSGDGLIVASFDPADKDLHVEVSNAQPWQSLFGGYGLAQREELDSRRQEVIQLNATAHALTTAVHARDEGIQLASAAYSSLETVHKSFVHDVQHERGLNQALLTAAQQLNAELMPKVDELLALKSSKLYRWSGLPRRVYYALRRIGKR